ncbi:winged helix-turn-helix transcriptional regulator [Sphingobacterium chungjuense]|uniref:winged helix-turn-helix transcriptional regulator n=1 Tax=Sphingobacterium chungjuense TaxID=2675553 RepID=UPI00140B4F43|nr:helix-turn-helix domain-containing protein [Sphingobacterium chungjuense]
MTTPIEVVDTKPCPASQLLKSLSGKWKPELFRLSLTSNLRFSTLLHQLPQASKQSISAALRDLQSDGLLARVILQEKPLRVEYQLTDKGKSLAPALTQIESLVLEGE